MSGTTIQQSPLGLSDEDFLNLPVPGSSVEVTEEAEPVVEEPVADPVEEPVVENPADPVVEEPVVEEEGNASDPAVVADPAEEAAEADPVADPVGSKPDGGAKEDGGTPKEGEPEADPAPVQETDYKGFYEKVLAPLKANGKTIEIRTPEEAIQLMQMGANYTRKLQDLAPYRKQMMMLEKASLLDDEKLSFLIDLDRKDPEAIRKLLKDANIDPLEIDMDDKKEYLGGNHTVTDEEANFRNALDEVTSTPQGAETVRLIHESWDQTSKDVLWAQPELMSVIQSQRDNGIYDQITTELERQKVLGLIKPTTPFIQAYQEVGRQIYGSKTAPQGQEQPAQGIPPVPANPVVDPPKPVATTVTAPKNQAINGDKAKAAGATRAEPRKATPFVNPFAQSDDEFMKNFENRL